MKLTTHDHLLPRIRMCGAVPPCLHDITLNYAECLHLTSYTIAVNQCNFQQLIKACNETAKSLFGVKQSDNSTAVTVG